ncbi:hypothetical protein ACFVMC_28735 [Nocardia sp. NPDC127579]|uniref:class III lanthionine synthetase LanKC N-terminal domain-containing protein n=1 Tax=Nocardia sp. NPDC127579 TaxID=3345402 RepID=UPI003637B162
MHLAPLPSDAAEVIARAADFCFRRKTHFKHLSRLEFTLAVNAKYAPRPSSGKVIVIYPGENDDVDTVLADLHAEFAGLSGPRVLGSYRLGDSIVHTRYGGFVERYVRDIDGDPRSALVEPGGRLIADVRDVVPRTPDFVERPAIVDAMAAQLDQSRAPVYSIVRALHFSNAGGVYLASHRATGDSVILKEARHHTGFDSSMRSAVDRLAAQRDALRGLRSTCTVPQLLDSFTQSDSDFLAYRFVPGVTLGTWAAENNPALHLAHPDRPIDPAAAKQFVEDVNRYMRQLNEIVERVHDAGFVVGDLQPANVIVGEHGLLWLVDLEGARSIADPVVEAVGTPGFTGGHAVSAARDRYALAATELHLYVPAVRMTTFVDGGMESLIEFAYRTFHLDDEWRARMRQALTRTGSGAGQSIPNPSTDEYVGLIARGVMRSLDFTAAHPIPTSPSGYQAHLCDSLSYGPGGAVWALACAGTLPNDIAQGYGAWLERRMDSFGVLGCGLLDGWAGNAVVAARIGHRELAADLFVRLTRCVELDVGPLNIRNGLAGYLLMCLWLADRDLPIDTLKSVESAADLLADRVADRLHRADAAPAGLLDGMAGIALALHRFHRICPKDKYAQAISAAFAASESTVGATGLESGAAGLALAAAELGMPADRWQRDASRRIGHQPGLYRGLAGGLAANAELRRHPDIFDSAYLDRCIDPIIAGIRSFSGTRSDYCLTPGLDAVRASTDLAHGGAGTLTALAFATGRSAEWLPAVF